MATKSEVFAKLRANVGMAKHFVLHSGGDNKAAGIATIDEVNETVRSLHGRGLRAVKDAQDSGAPVQPVLDNPDNYFEEKISNIFDVI